MKSMLTLFDCISTFSTQFGSGQLAQYPNSFKLIGLPLLSVWEKVVSEDKILIYLIDSLTDLIPVIYIIGVY